MKMGGALFTKTIALTIISVAVAASLIIRPVLAQEDSSTDSVDQAASIDATVATTTADTLDAATDTATVPHGSATVTSSDTSTQLDTSMPEPAPSDTFTAPTDTSTVDAAATTTVQTTEQPPVGLTQVHIVGTKYIDYFTDGTTVTAYPGDPEVDAHLDGRDAAMPTHEGLTWVHTTGQYLYDTPSGDLEPGDYAVQPNGAIIANQVFVSSTSTPSTSSTESSSATSAEVLGAPTSPESSSTADTSTPVSAPDTSAFTSDAAQADAASGASAAKSQPTSTGATTQ